MQAYYSQYNYTEVLKPSYHCSVGIATSWTTGVRFPVETKHFPLLYSVQTVSGALPASYPLGTGDSFSMSSMLWGPPNFLYNGYRELFPGGKAAGA
jgi:hypothetical protein